MSAFDPKRTFQVVLQWGENWRHEGDPGVSEAHPYYKSQRSEMEASMRMRLDLIDDLLQQHLSLTDASPVKSDMMQEFEVVLTQMPYVGGAESRRSDFFMRLLGFMAIGRVCSGEVCPKT